MTDIKLYNTKTRSKEIFKPLIDGKASMYVCGPTVYERAHIGNARPVLVFDILYRLLRHEYGADNVTYVRNFTDVDDKINARAAETGRDIGSITDETIGWFLDDMGSLGALEPDHAPRATQYIDEMQAMISELIDKGFAYEATSTLGHNSNARIVYLDSETTQAHAFLSVDDLKAKQLSTEYGSLSGRSTDDMIVGSRAEVGEGKKNPMDSVLWKPSTLDQPGWKSPWGFGRPGWHIECSAMSRSLLGKKFDIHGGGLDLLFPHHENELAQCVACDGPNASAQYWMHNEMLQVEGKKMSKSLGNFFTVRDLLDQGVPGEVIRFVMLSTHYRKPMDWTEKKRQEAIAMLSRWGGILSDVEPSKSVPEAVLKPLRDDLNIYAARTAINDLIKRGDLSDALAGLEFLGIDPIYSLTIETAVDRMVHDGQWDDIIEATLNAIRDARSEKNYSESDRLRDLLYAAGISMTFDKDGGITFNKEAAFDPTKLVALK